MDILKKNQYVILLLVVILFVSLSFSVILNIPLQLYEFQIQNGIREGLTCLPTCDKVAFNNTTASIPECKEYKDKLLKSEDAKLMVNECVNPFITNINNIMKSKYDYNNIYKTLYAKNAFMISQKEINKYFIDASFVTIQDIMDKLYDNIDNIRKNESLKSKDISQIINQINAYKADREIPSSDIKQKYDDFISSVEKFMESLSARCENYYTDENLNTLIKDVKETKSYYGLSSSFHKIYEYIIERVNGE